MKYFALILQFFILQNSWSQVNPCLESQSFKIVVLGSSTAAGTGVSTSDSAWVNRYREYVTGINGDNEVINLAVGGFSTYKIMPSAFVPPVNRPLSDTNKNITKALSLNPDAIIVNLPSNDISSGYSVMEQLYNLDSVFSLSNQNNIPIWICTTQPKNHLSSATRQLQEDLKDSINLKYGVFTIDFWTTIALPDNSINPTYNADGTHLNDAGHHVLVDRVMNTNILNQLYSSISYTDYWAREISTEMSSLCGDSTNIFKVVVANIGDSNSLPTMVYFKLENMTSGFLVLDSLQIQNGIQACVYDTVSFVGSTYSAGNYKVSGIVKNASDTVFGNDTAFLVFHSLGHPISNISNDTLCSAGSGDLVAQVEPGDTTFWYQNNTDSNSIASGNYFQTPSLGYTNSWYAETIRGDLYHSNSLLANKNSSIDFNGVMFDLVGNEDIIMDSFDVKIASVGLQIVEVYYKTGSYLGYELDATAWTFLGFETVDVLNIDEFTRVKLGNLPLNNGDTMGVYIQMANPSSNLSYQWVSAPITRSNNELSILTGSGISHNHTNYYYPRDWNGKVYYHFGSRPNGECKTERTKATTFISQTNFSIGNDTIIDIFDSITFNGPSGALSYWWFDGSTNQSLTLQSANLGLGIHYVTLEIEDSLKCHFTEETVLGIADLVSVQESNNYEIKIFPNPVQNRLWIDAVNVESIKLFSTEGKMVLENLNTSNTIDVSRLIPGIYILNLRVNGKDYVSKIIKQ
ncbi:MAG: lysophospholipase L1-like esterase [Salibacteraceae bacterium]|jgi:lysophospholipase L1-like esterase